MVLELYYMSDFYSVYLIDISKSVISKAEDLSLITYLKRDNR